MLIIFFVTAILNKRDHGRAADHQELLRKREHGRRVCQVDCAANPAKCGAE